MPATPVRLMLPPVLCVVAAMAFFSVGTSLAKGLFPHVGAAGTTAYRVTFSAAILLVVLRPWRRTDGRARSGRDVAALAGYGVALGGMNLLFYQAIARVPFGIAVAIEFAGPLAVAVATSRRPLDFVWAGLAAAGLAVLLPSGGGGPGAGRAAVDPVGVACALSAGACWAAYILLGRRAGNAFGSGATALGMVGAAALVLPFGLASAGTALLDPTLLLCGVGVAALSSALPYSLEMVALARLPARTFSVLLSLEPAAGAACGFLVLGERLSGPQGLAIAAVVAASVGAAATAGTAATAGAAGPRQTPPVAD